MGAIKVLQPEDQLVVTAPIQSRLQPGYAHGWLQPVVVQGWWQPVVGHGLLQGVVQGFVQPREVQATLQPVLETVQKPLEQLVPLQ
jgi:hypothetical protein